MDASQFFKAFQLAPAQLQASFESRQSLPRLPPALAQTRKFLKFHDSDPAENETTDFLQNLNYLNFRNKALKAEIVDTPDNSLKEGLVHSKKMEEASRFASIIRKRSTLSPTVALSVVGSGFASPPAASIRWPAVPRTKYEPAPASSSQVFCAVSHEVAPDYSKVLQYVPEVVLPSTIASSSSSSRLQWVLDSKPVYKEKRRSTNLRLPSPAVAAVVERCLDSLDDQSVHRDEDNGQTKRTKTSYIHSCASRIHGSKGGGGEEGAMAKEKAFKEALARHFEAVLDSLLHTVFSAVRQAKIEGISRSMAGEEDSNSCRKRTFADLDAEPALGWEELYTIIKALVNRSTDSVPPSEGLPRVHLSSEAFRRAAQRMVFHFYQKPKVEAIFTGKPHTVIATDNRKSASSSHYW